MMVGHAAIETSSSKLIARRHPAFFPALSSVLIVLVFLGLPLRTICGRSVLARYRPICTCTARR